MLCGRRGNDKMINYHNLIKDIEEVFEKHEIHTIKSYWNGEDGYWAFDKDRILEIIFKVNHEPTAEDIENFEEQINE